MLLGNELKKLKTLVGSTGNIKFDEGERENSFTRGLYDYLQQSYLVYECKRHSSRTDKSNRLVSWRSSGIQNFSANSDLKAIPNAQRLLPVIENDGRMNVEFNGNYFEQGKVLHPGTDKAVNIYIVYKLDPIISTRNTDYTIQNALFGAIKLLKMLISQKTTTQDTEFILMKAVSLAIRLKSVVLIVLQMLET